MKPGQSFANLYSHGFVRVAVGIPRGRVADPRHNAAEVVTLLREAAGRRAGLALFPELALSAYSCEDLFHQRALLDASEDALATVLAASRDCPIVGVVGVPLAVDGLLYNCAAVFLDERILGVVPKTYLPNYREFYEARHFASADAATRDAIDVCGQRVPFGTKLLFRVEEQPLLVLHVELCEDLWVPIPPSSWAALAGATLLANLSASNVTVAKADYRRALVTGQSARCLAAYAYAGAGAGESTTDLAWDGHGLVAENGTLLAESVRFRYERQLVCADVDLERLASERMRQTTFAQSVSRHRGELDAFRAVAVPLRLPADAHLPLARTYERSPYVPADPGRRDERCAEVYEIQVQGLVKRLEATGLGRLVIGVSGGLDSAHALLVCARAMDVLGRPRADIVGCAMPGFATTERTAGQARALMRAVGCTVREMDIRPSSLQMLGDIGHPYAEGRPVYDVTFENVQAGERTSHLFRLANLVGGLVVGTSDLSELALGWCTYGVGDQMSHYAVNASVPKTLVRHLVRWVAERPETSADARAALEGILATTCSPELVPGSGDQPAQATEDVLGPFELHDFTLYYVLRFGYAPTKVAFLAAAAWQDVYGLDRITACLRVFLERFFRTSQFKRSALPNGPKVGSGGSLSPRSDYRAPSDSEAEAWLAGLALVPDR